MDAYCGPPAGARIIGAVISRNPMPTPLFFHGLWRGRKSTVATRCGALLAAVLCLAAAPAVAQRFSTKPLLRVETGTHAGGINAIATDAANRYLVSSSGDKTLRIWSRSTGELLKTIRPPIGEGARGSASSVAMTPDGSSVAAGGNFCAWYEDKYCVLLFDTASGQLKHQLRALPSMVSHLAFSPDGTMLAVGMNGTGGLRLVRTADWTEIGADADYRGYISDIHFDGRGRVATASDDLNVRVYRVTGASLALIIKKPVSDLTRPSGRPFGVRFSPDGTRLAISQARGVARVTVHDPETFEMLVSASTNWGREFGANRLAWSADGQYLYASVGAVQRLPLFIRRWSGGGKGSAIDLPVGSSTGINGLVAMADGSIAYATGSAVIGVYDRDGKPVWENAPQSGQFYGTTEAFKVSEDGARVEFSYDGSSQGVMNFDVQERKLANGPAKDVAMRAPSTAGGTLNFYNQWRDTRSTLAVGNRRLALGAFETARSLSIAPDHQSFAVGSSGQLRNFGRDGRQLWAVATVFDVFAVNHSGDGRMIVAALRDGTIRWFQRPTGRLLATLYVAPDKKRWVIATPSGHYDASVGAEEFLGWHVNRGPAEAADFFPVSRLRSMFYRPEVVAGVIRTADIGQAVKLASAELAASAAAAPAPGIAAAPPMPSPTLKPPPPPAPATPPAPPVSQSPSPARMPSAPVPSQTASTPEGAEEAFESTVDQTVVDISQVLPPVVTILSPEPNATVISRTVTVRYQVRSAAGAPVTGVRVRVNGLAHDARNLVIPSVSEMREIAVEVPPEDSEILLFAESRHGISAPASVRVIWRGKTIPRAEEKPVLYVLSIGVSKYDDPSYSLSYPAKDARDFVKTMQKQKGRLYGDVVVRVLTDRDASSASVIEGFTWLQQQVTVRDIGMVFIAGHGLNDDRGRYFFLPANVDLDRLDATGVPFTAIRSLLAKLRGKGLLFVDTCHSGNVMGGRLGYSIDVNGMINDLSSAEYGLVVLASSTGKQVSLEDAEWNNGAFTKALVEGLNGQADLKKRGRITHKMLDFYVSDRVDELTQGRQTPVNPSPQGVPDYPIAIAET